MCCSLDKRDDRSYQHHEHHRVANLDARIELPERANKGLPEDLRIKETPRLGNAPRCSGWPCLHCFHLRPHQTFFPIRTTVRDCVARRWALAKLQGRMSIRLR